MRMKKISLFALALATGAAVYAQESQPQLRTPMETKTRFGIRAGVNLSTVNMSGQASVVDGAVNGANSKTSYNAGLLVNIPLGLSAFRFQPEVGFSSQGARFTGGTGAGFRYENDLNYVNVPLNFQWMVSPNGFFVQTGPQIGFLTTANTKNAEGTGAPANNTDLKDRFNSVDFGWTAGLGFVSRIGLGVDARYNLGIRNVRKDGTANTTPMMTGNWRNNVAQISLLYHFGAHR
jgi:hypothetical protein